MSLVIFIGGDVMNELKKLNKKRVLIFGGYEYGKHAETSRKFYRGIRRTGPGQRPL